MKNKKLNTLLGDGIFDSSLVKALNKNNFANLFDVVNKGAKSYFNICRGIHFKNAASTDPGMFREYTIVENDSWTSISYRFYHTVELWWLICKFNGVKNPFKELTPGNVILIPSNEIKDMVLTAIINY